MLCTHPSDKHIVLARYANLFARLFAHLLSADAHDVNITLLYTVYSTASRQ
jgi:hypothetical protein